MDKSTSLVPLGINQLETLPVNVGRRLSADDKKKLLLVLEKAMREKSNLLDAKRTEVENEILRAEKEKLDLERYRKQMDDLNAEIDAMVSKRDAITRRCENETGFQMDGSLIVSPHRRYNEPEDEYQLRGLVNKKGIEKANKIREKIRLALIVFERFATKFDKIETRLILADNYGEAMQIMDAVLGNGDDILNIDTKDKEAPV